MSTNFQKVHGLQFGIDGCGFAGSAQADLECISEAISERLLAVDATELRRIHAGALITDESDGDPACVEFLTRICREECARILRAWYKSDRALVTLSAMRN